MKLNWQHQAKANADFVAVADFTLYDHILDYKWQQVQFLLALVSIAKNLTLDQYFQLARGNKPNLRLK